MKSSKVTFVAMILIMAMSIFLACGGPVVKRINQDKATVQTTTTTTTPQTTTTRVETKTVAPAPAAASKGIAVSSKPIAYVRIGDPNKPAQSVAGKLGSPGRIWRRQIMLYNDATEDMVAERMKEYVLGLVPNRPPIIESAGEWDTYGYWLMDKYGNSLSEPEDNVTAHAQIVYAPPAPVAAAPPAAKIQNIIRDERPKETTAAPKPYPKDWEAKLNRLGYFCYRAIWDFQTDARADGSGICGRKIVVDGILGPQTKEAIERYLFALEKCRNGQTDSKVIKRALAAAATAKK